jgi:diguanylate cyclase (GGDEF)-like protein
VPSRQTRTGTLLTPGWDALALETLRDTLSFEERRSNYDALTGLGNRRSLERRLTRLSGPFRPRGGGLSVVIVDIDNFKSINQQLGHLAGDALLKEFGRRLRRSLRRRDYVGRFGGDEFAVLLPNTSATKAREIAEHLRVACEISLVVSCTRIVEVSASLGIASHTQGLRSYEILSCADAALSQAKTEGRNCVRECPQLG